MNATSVLLDESERQMTLLALAVLALQRPGWNDALREIATKLLGEPMWVELKRLNSDVVRPL